MPAISTGLAIGLGAMSAAGSIGGAEIQSHAAGKAADAQSQAAMYSADLQKQAADQSLGFQKQQYQTGQSELGPYLQSGVGALTNLNYLLGLPVQGNATFPGAGPAPRGGPRVGGPVGAPGMSAGGMNVAGSYRGGGGGVMPHGFKSPLMGGPASTLRNGGPIQMPGAQPAPGAGGLQTHQVSLQSLINPALGAKGSLLTPFTPPTDVTMQNDPGYAFRKAEGDNAIERSAAARGGVLTGGTAKALDQFNQDYASNEYQNVYNRSHDTYQTNYLNKLNPLMAMAGLGQVAGGEMLSAGNNSANAISNILQNAAAGEGAAYQNAAAGRASGYINSANAWGGALGGSTNNLMSLILGSQMFGRGNGGGGSNFYGGSGQYNPVTGQYNG